MDGEVGGFSGEFLRQLAFGERIFWVDSEEFLRGLPEGDPFTVLLRYQGIVHRALENRKTIEVYIDNQHYFIKQHLGVGWREIIKNLLQGRLPILGATNEWRALQLLPQLSIATLSLVAFGRQGYNPAQQKSFIVTRALENTVSLEELFAKGTSQRPAITLKYALIAEVARMARCMHAAGMNHRDFYLCHFLLHIPAGVADVNPRQFTLYLIDLHRALIHSKVSKRWLVKDLAGLYFSSMNCGFTQKDIWRFLRGYYQCTLRHIFTEHNALLASVKKRAEQLYRRHHVLAMH